ncbi:hypothetical protein B0H15DRAFT_785330, partial [Mycena belliarum]
MHPGHRQSVAPRARPLDGYLPNPSLRAQGPPPTTQLALPPSAFQNVPRIVEPGEYFRSRLNLPRDVPVSLWSVPDTADGQRPSLPLPLLAQLAIYGSEEKRLSLQGIYSALVSRFTYFRDNAWDSKWKNSIRHALSLYSAFVKISRPIQEAGKGDYWTLNPCLPDGYKRPRKR